MLPDLQPDSGSNIVAENIRAVQAIYFAHQLESMQAFEVADRLVKLSQEGLLPLGKGRADNLFKRYVTTADRLSAQQRQDLYVRALGVPGGAGPNAQANTEFHSLWLRFVASVTLFERQQATLPALVLAESQTTLWRVARALAVNASAYGAKLVDPTRRLSMDANLLRTLLQAPQTLKALGARDMWQVIDQVASTHLGGARNVARRRTLAHAGSAILQWLADHADALDKPAAVVPGVTFPDPELTVAVQTWLAASRTPDGLAPASSPVQIWETVRELARIMGIESMLGRRRPPTTLEVESPHGMVALFCGAAGSGKTLGAHALAAALARDLVRVDLRGIVSKYIGETEKNLAGVLARVDRTGALLLLDEADALFRKRTDVKDAHDRYANSAMDPVLQRLRAHQGLTILESNIIPSGGDGGSIAGLSHLVRFPR